MTKGNPRWVLVLGFLLSAACPHSQLSAQPGSINVNLGVAAVRLYGPWKFTIGDSPIDPKNGKPLWAEPGFDDSHWETVDLTPKNGAIDPFAGLSGYVPGWTARGHAGYWGYAWYRIRVRYQSSQPLALAGPADADDAYQAFMDGDLLGGFGDFTGNRPIVYFTRPAMFRLPQRGDGFEDTRVLAFRLWMEPGTLIEIPDAGGMHSAPLLGESGVVMLHHQSQWLELIRAYLGRVLLAPVFTLLAVVAFSLILFDRSDPVYLWISFLFLVTAFISCLIALAEWTNWISLRHFLLIIGILEPLTYALWIIVWWVWFGRTGFRWLQPVTGGLTFVLIVARILGNEIIPGVVSHHAALRFYAISQAVRFVLFGLLVLVVADGIRRHGLDGWLVLPVVLMRGISLFILELGQQHIPIGWFPFGVGVGLNEIADLLIVAVIALLLLRRLLQSVKRQKQMALDVKQAQEIQQVILPEHRIVLPGLEIESEYRPAREVGGDFFQIIPQASDGSLLIVAGDVSGKGLKAGMLVALLVGAIRTVEDSDSSPEFILDALNRRLLGRGDERATCLAMRIERDGAVTLANAGHLPPYLNGAPLNIAGSLPLGMIEQLECSVLQFSMAESDRLLLLSDGVAEATDKDGKLFGFERVLELIRTQPTAEKIAQTAQAFGQEDDISVIAVTKIAVAEPALA